MVVILKKKKKKVWGGGNVNSDISFSPLRPSIWNNIDITETNKTLYNNKGVYGFLPSWVSAQKQQM